MATLQKPWLSIQLYMYIHILDTLQSSKHCMTLNPIPLRYTFTTSYIPRWRGSAHARALVCLLNYFVYKHVYSDWYMSESKATYENPSAPIVTAVNKYNSVWAYEYEIGRK